jgi:glycosyltransferase involved in cell wall biosynthesis
VAYTYIGKAKEENMNANMIIIPALNPDERLIALVDELISQGQTHIMVVDDGSDMPAQEVFRSLDKMGCLVHRHDGNKGKGEAIKTGIQLSKDMPAIKGYVTADADGQHLARDILSVAAALEEHPDSIVLGARDVQNRKNPAKSRFGNRFSALFFHLTTGENCPDTQTGLRGFSRALTEFALAAPGRRYDYEMNFLLAAAKKKIPFFIVPIQTVYYRNNAASHFRPIVDSYRVYKTPLKFAGASLVSAGVDLLLFTLMTHAISAQISALVFVATATARIISGALNFTLNRNWTFNSDAPWRPQAARYLGLFLSIMLASWLLVWGFSSLPLPLPAIKAIIDSTLFVISYLVQRNLVFRKNRFFRKLQSA